MEAEAGFRKRNPPKRQNNKCLSLRLSAGVEKKKGKKKKLQQFLCNSGFFGPCKCMTHTSSLKDHNTDRLTNEKKTFINERNETSLLRQGDDTLRQRYKSEINDKCAGRRKTHGRKGDRGRISSEDVLQAPTVSLWGNGGKSQELNSFL